MKHLGFTQHLEDLGFEKHVKHSQHSGFINKWD
jgi:hypothetical protein